MTQQETKVSIIIRCLNESKFIEKLLIGIEQQTYKNVEVIVVDSGSTDGTIEIAQKYTPHIVQIRPEDFSFGYALNVGCQAATGELLLFASAHVYPVYHDWIEKIIAPFSDERIALVYGRQIGGKPTKFSEHEIFRKWFPAYDIHSQKNPFCNNANCAIRRSLWLIQPYDESLTGLEDLDWAKKIQEAGYKINYQSTATIVHLHEETPSRVFNRYRREAIALKSIMHEESFSLFDFFKLSIANILSDYIQAFRQGKIFRVFFDIPVFRVMQFWGTYRGYRQGGIVSHELRNRFYYPNGISKSTERATEQPKIDYSI